jgi:protein-disulfide isomerase
MLLFQEGETMSKRQDIRERRKKEQVRNRLVVIGLVIIGAFLITFALVMPGIQNQQNAKATQTAVAGTANADPIYATPRAFNTTENGTRLGDPNAPVQVKVFADFRCSGCAWYVQNLETQIITNYVETGKVYYQFANFIVIDGYDQTDASERAANAALCAAEQNKFWAYHDILYANQITESADLYTDPRLEKMAQFVGLDMTAFDKCYSTKKYAPQVSQDINEAQTLGVHSTPSIFVNGQYIDKPENVIPAIDAALAGG